MVLVGRSLQWGRDSANDVGAGRQTSGGSFYTGVYYHVLGTDQGKRRSIQVSLELTLVPLASDVRVYQHPKPSYAVQSLKVDFPKPCGDLLQLYIRNDYRTDSLLIADIGADGIDTDRRCLKVYDTQKDSFM